ncbi:PEGA domain-containing protein [Bacteroidota bacterium]
MKKSLIITILFLINLQLFADEFVVIDFYHDPSDLSARRDPRLDINGEQCAIIKVFTDITGMLFETNIGIEGDVEKKQGEYWLYVSRGEKRIKISCKGFVPFDFNIPQKIESGNVYILKITNKEKGISFIDRDLINIKFRFNVEDVLVSINEKTPIKVMGTIADLQLSSGESTFKFIKDGYDDYDYKMNVTEERVVDINLVQGVQTSRLKLPGIVIITSDPPAAEIFLNNQKIGITPYTAELIAGSYQMMLKKEMHQDYSGSFELNEGETKQLPQITLVSNSAYINITSNPSNANVYIDDKLIGTTPISDWIVTSGSYNIKIQNELYYPDEQIIVLEKGDVKNLDFILKPAFGVLKITSEPTNADIYIDGQFQGNTPYTNPKLRSGNYNIRVGKELWNEVTSKIVITDGDTTEKLMVLSKNFGKVSIIADESEIFLDNKKVGNDKLVLNLEQGNYTIKASKPQHYDHEKDIFVTIGSDRTYTLKPQQKTGSITVISEPFETQGAEIWLNGEFSGKVTPAVMELLIGNYEITIKKENFKTQTRNISVTENSKQKLDFQLAGGKYKSQKEKPPITTKKAEVKKTEPVPVIETDLNIAKLKSKKSRINTWRFVWLGSTVLTAGAGVLVLNAAENNYKEYQIATTEATDLHKTINTQDFIWKVSFAVSVTSLAMTIVNSARHSKIKKKISMSAIPYKNGMQIGLICKF